MQSYPVKLTSERVFCTMDFARRLRSGVTLSSCSVSIAVVRGADLSPSDVLDGPCTVTSGVAGIWCHGGLSGCSYELTFSGVASDGSQPAAAVTLPVQDPPS